MAAGLRLTLPSDCMLDKLLGFDRVIQCGVEHPELLVAQQT
jgi:hypothetical protein